MSTCIENISSEFRDQIPLLYFLVVHMHFTTFDVQSSIIVAFSRSLRGGGGVTIWTAFSSAGKYFIYLTPKYSCTKILYSE